MSLLVEGTVVSVSVGPYTHYGVVSQIPFGVDPLIISNSRRLGIVGEESVSDFADGKEVSVVGYPGNLAPSVVLERAKSMLGSKYDPVTWNCEHFYKWAHGLKVESPQLQVTAILSVAVLCLYWAAKRK